MSPAGGLRTKRGAVAALALGVLAAGSARLAVDEVRLAGHTARTRGLEQRADAAVRDRRRLVRLEKDLQVDQERLSDLTQDLQTANRDVQSARGALRQAHADRTSLEQRAVTEKRQLKRLLTESERVTAQAALDLERLQAVAERRAQELEASKQLAEQRAESLAQARRDSEALAEDLAEQARAITKLNADVRLGLNRANLAEEQLSLLEAAGINVARLTGRRPMPRIFAVVVRVDTEAVPPRILVDAGRDRGLERGDTLYVVRDGREIARLEVDEVSGQASSTRIVQGLRGLSIRPGEDVSSVTPARSPR